MFAIVSSALSFLLIAQWPCSPRLSPILSVITSPLEAAAKKSDVNELIKNYQKDKDDEDYGAKLAEVFLKVSSEEQAKILEIFWQSVKIRDPDSAKANFATTFILDQDPSDSKIDRLITNGGYMSITTLLIEFHGKFGRDQAFKIFRRLETFATGGWMTTFVQKNISSTNSLVASVGGRVITKPITILAWRDLESLYDKVVPILKRELTEAAINSKIKEFSIMGLQNSYLLGSDAEPYISQGFKDRKVEAAIAFARLRAPSNELTREFEVAKNPKFLMEYLNELFLLSASPARLSELRKLLKHKWSQAKAVKFVLLWEPIAQSSEVSDLADEIINAKNDQYIVDSDHQPLRLPAVSWAMMRTPLSDAQLFENKLDDPKKKAAFRKLIQEAVELQQFKTEVQKTPSAERSKMEFKGVPLKELPEAIRNFLEGIRFDSNRLQVNSMGLSLAFLTYSKDSEVLNEAEDIIRALNLIEKSESLNRGDLLWNYQNLFEDSRFYTEFDYPKISIGATKSLFRHAEDPQ
ncbi:MAG: hypothetical protein JWQ35_460 [Bacteriovoracaceae bacterium]|nr:hypothetical protein [Bacteriovoracaceae bacterium]